MCGIAASFRHSVIRCHHKRIAVLTGRKKECSAYCGGFAIAAPMKKPPELDAPGGLQAICLDGFAVC
jgi:hypothetical protein